MLRSKRVTKAKGYNNKHAKQSLYSFTSLMIKNVELRFWAFEFGNGRRYIKL